MKQLHDVCPLCSSEKFSPYEKYHTVNGLRKCANCGFVFMEKVPSENELNVYYASYSYNSEAYLSPITVRSYNKLLDEFEKFRIHNSLLDVGCGRGWFLEEAQKRGWKVYGTEYSETAVELCKSKGIDMRQGDLKAGDFADMKFDVVTSFEVIEHLSFPGKHLEEIKKLMRRGGLFYCTTPNFNSIPRFIRKTDFGIICYPEHLSYFTKSTLCRLAEMHGLKKVRFKSTGISLALMRKPDNKPQVSMNSQAHPDEQLRQKIEKRHVFQIAKQIINFFLTISNTGVTLKGYFVKDKT